MKKLIRVKASPESSKAGIEKKKEDLFLISVREKAEGGMANDAVLKALALELGVQAKTLRIIKGARSKSKIIEILG